jgi:prepilin-type N-terminal cleavage/methylation domain-containing protein
MFNKRNAFTLIELLVVIAIVGVLSGFIFVSMTGAINSAKDAKRKADLAAIENAILIYKTNNNGLPSSGANCNICNGCSGACDDLYSNLQQYLPVIPTDPNSGIFYKYNAVSVDNYTLQSNLSNGDIYEYDSADNAWITLSGVQATPTFNPVAGTVTAGTTVTIISSGADAIYYTTDGSDPTISSINQAITPLVINSSVTVKALAVKAGYTNSTIGTAAYTMFSYGQYKKTITILNNPSGSSIAGAYPVKLTINTAALVTAAKMRSDCNDLRFSDNLVTTNLSYWIESGCNTASTIVWVRLPNGIPATTGTTINMYYGTQTVSSANGDNTFSFFDHFLGNSMSGSWTHSFAAGSSSVSNSILTISGNSGTNERWVATMPISSWSGYAIDMYGAWSNTQVISMGGFTTAGTYTSSSYGINTYSCSWTNVQQTGLSAGGSGYYIVSLKVPMGSGMVSYDRNYSTIGSGTMQCNATFTTEVGSWASTSNYNVNIDWFRLRRYVSAEPTSGTITFGAEEIGQ